MVLQSAFSSSRDQFRIKPQLPNYLFTHLASLQVLPCYLSSTANLFCQAVETVNSSRLYDVSLTWIPNHSNGETFEFSRIYLLKMLNSWVSSPTRFSLPMAHFSLPMPGIRAAHISTTSVTSLSSKESSKMFVEKSFISSKTLKRSCREKNQPQITMPFS